MGSCSVHYSILAAAGNSKKKKNAHVRVNVGVCQGSCHPAATVCLIDVVIFILGNNGTGTAVQTSLRWEKPESDNHLNYQSLVYIIVYLCVYFSVITVPH